MGIGEYPAVLAISLGAGDTTVVNLVNAYSMLANGGKDLKPSLIDMVQDRRGKIIYRADTRPCEGCNARDWNGKEMRSEEHTSELQSIMRSTYAVFCLKKKN